MGFPKAANPLQVHAPELHPSAEVGLRQRCVARSSGSHQGLRWPLRPQDSDEYRLIKRRADKEVAPEERKQQ